jgi:hypothetical protein
MLFFGDFSLDFCLAGIHQSIKRNAVLKRMEKACVNHLGSQGPMAGLS